MSSFWGKKLGGAGVSPQNPVSPPRPQQMPAHLLPRGMAGRQQQAVQRYVDHLPAFQDQPYDGWQPNQVSPKTMDEVLPIWHWRGNPRGGAGESLGPCPNCGSANYFSRREGSVMHVSGQSMAPAPHCFECGYPRQQGELGASVAETAEQHMARQAQAPAPAGSMAALGTSGP